MHYVVGFLFEVSSLGRVVLIEKRRPHWQAGRLNGVDGKVEPLETPEQAMHREFLEETGHDQGEWQHFATLDTLSMDRIDFFRGTAMEVPTRVRSQTDEKIVCVRPSELDDLHCVSNVPWLVRMAQSMYRGERAGSFHIVEAGANGGR